METMVRIARGELTEDALAAVASVVLALTGRAAREHPRPPSAGPRWHNPYRSPSSWHDRPGPHS
jgi:hypothetical protein